VWRRGFAVYQAKLDQVERDALDVVRAARSFAEVCATLEAGRAAPDDAVREAGALLMRWIEDGILAAPA
jgi:hypothetical protein